MSSFKHLTNHFNILQITLLIGFGWNLKPFACRLMFFGVLFFLCETCSMALYLWSCYMFSKFALFLSCIVSHGKHVCKEGSCLEQLVEKWGGTLHWSGNKFILVFRTEIDVIIKVSFADKFPQEQVKLLSMLSSFHSGVPGCVQVKGKGKNGLGLETCCLKTSDCNI